MTYIDSLFLSLFLLLYIIGRAQKAWWPALKRIYWVVVIIGVFYVPAETVSHRFKTKMYLSNRDAMDKFWVEAQKWANLHSLPDDMFVTPLDGGFRVFSKRPVFIEWPDMAAVHWSKNFESSWFKRVEQLGYTMESIKLISEAMQKNNVRPTNMDAYNNMNEDQFRVLARDYKVRFAVVHSFKNLSFPLRYSNKYFRIYEIITAEDRSLIKQHET